VIDAPVVRVLVPRVLGLGVAVALGLVAVALVAYGVGRPVTWLTTGLVSFADWVSTAPSPGVAVLAGVGLVLLALLAALVMVRRRRSGLLRLEKTRAGTTWIDVRSVAQVLEGVLRRDVERGVRVGARGDRLSIVTPASREAPLALADAATEAGQSELAVLGLSQIRYQVAVGPEAPPRKQARVQ
jgi:hypothetical protein